MRTFILNNENIYQDIFRVQEGGGIGWPTGDIEGEGGGTKSMNTR